MKKILLFIIAIWTPTIYACGGNAGEIKKYINHISIEKKSGNKNQCRHMEILFKEKNTYPYFIESAHANLIQNKITISQVAISLEEIIDGVSYARFCLSDRLIEESKISFIVKQNETVKITPKGLIEHSAGSLCFAEIIVDVKDLSATASIIDSP